MKQPVVEDFADGGRFAKNSDAKKFKIIRLSSLNRCEQLMLLKNIKIDMNAPSKFNGYNATIFYHVLNLYFACDTHDTHDTHDMCNMHVNVHDVIKLFIERGADVNARDARGRSILHKFVLQSIHSHTYEVIEFLLKNGADIYATYDIYIDEFDIHKYENIFEMAFEYPKNITNIIKLLIDHVDINHRFEYDSTILMYAIVHSQVPIEIIQYIIDRGADVKAADENGTTALHLSVSFYRDKKMLDIVKLLIANGADVNSLADDRSLTPGKSALMMAINDIDEQEVLIDMVELLIRAGADINYKNSIRETALSVACAQYKYRPGLIDVILILVNAGAVIETDYEVNSELLIKILTELSQLRMDLKSIKLDFTNTIVAFASRDALSKKDDNGDKK
jgi:ankyrin repeat protein